MAREAPDSASGDLDAAAAIPGPKSQKFKSRKGGEKNPLAAKRRCVSSACIACRRRKSKCDGNLPSCAACASVYGTECVYDPNSDHRRKGVYKKDIDNLKTRNTTLQTLVQGILNYPESEVYDLVKRIRTCENLEDVADEIIARDADLGEESDEKDDISVDSSSSAGPKIEKELSGKMGELRLENGAVRFLGGTSNLLYLDSELILDAKKSTTIDDEKSEDSVTSWTLVTSDKDLIVHLLNMYFTWHYTYFTTLSKSLFFRDFWRGKRKDGSTQSEYCTPLLVNAMLAVGCHFTSWPASRSDPSDPSTAGDHFFKEAKRLIVENDEFENPGLATVQALALMSVREAGCGREAKGWVYSGMSFRMACDLGLNLGLTGGNSGSSSLKEQEIDARRITFWGCFLFDKCWSNYLGRAPQLVIPNITTPKFDVFPEEDADLWSPWTDAGPNKLHEQPSRTRAIALQISTLCEISSDLLLAFYRPASQQTSLTKPAEVKRLSDFHTRLEAWRKALPKEMEPRDSQLPNVILMHMFFHLLFIHLFRPFLKYTQPNSPLPPQASPRKMCTQAAVSISKLFRLYKKTYGLKQICNIAVYIAHSACTIHLLNLPDRDARRDISHGVRHLEEVAESWLCASRTLATLGIQARRWRIELPEDTASILQRWESKYRSDHALSALGKISPTIEQAQRVASTKSNTPASSNPRPADALFPRPPSANSAGNANLEDPQASLSAQIATELAPEPAIYQPQEPMPLQQSQNGVQANWDSTASDIATTAVPPQTQPQQLQRPSYSSLFPGLDTLFEDSKEWWLRDQSAFFDDWGTRRESNVNNMTNAPDHNSVGSGSLPATNNMQDLTQMNNNAIMNGVGNWDFGAGIGEGGFEYPNGQATY